MQLKNFDCVSQIKDKLFNIMVNILFRETKAVQARWRSANTLDSYSGGPELKFWCR